jgi:solute carrier family 13 (sodium-dependent dicarboxylate transporter), member 2/3/5
MSETDDDVTSAGPWRRAALPAGPLLGAGLYALLLSAGHPHGIAFVAALTLLVAIWWIFEPVPIPFTSLLPLALLPAAGVLSAKEVGAAYGDPLILLLLGGFILSRALEVSGVHRRMALKMLTLTGGYSGRSLVYGLLFASAAISMWISNAATCLMLLPIALALLGETRDRRLGVAVLLAIAYGASVGGMATPVGTPPNLIFMRVYEETTGAALSFLDYMQMALPITLTFIPLIGLWLTRRVGKGAPMTLPDPGPWRAAEVRVLIVFSLTALLWITRNEPFGGWSGWLNLPGANDASVALLACVALALIPNGDRVKPAKLLTWKQANQIPWGILLLFGSGVAIAEGFSASGLSGSLGAGLSDALRGLPPILLIALICLVVTFLTEVTSNTAVATLLMPIMAAAALAAGVDPKLLMFPAVISASCAFMLPVATAPNAIVFGSGRITVAEMAREGFAVNLIGVVVITLWCVFWL